MRGLGASHNFLCSFQRCVYTRFHFFEVFIFPTDKPIPHHSTHPPFSQMNPPQPPLVWNNDALERCICYNATLGEWCGDCDEMVRACVSGVSGVTALVEGLVFLLLLALCALFIRTRPGMQRRQHTELGPHSRLAVRSGVAILSILSLLSALCTVVFASKLHTTLTPPNNTVTLSIQSMTTLFSTLQNTVSIPLHNEAIQHALSSLKDDQDAVFFWLTFAQFAGAGGVVAMVGVLAVVAIVLTGGEGAQPHTMTPYGGERRPLLGSPVLSNLQGAGHTSHGLVCSSESVSSEEAAPTSSIVSLRTIQSCAGEEEKPRKKSVTFQIDSPRGSFRSEGGGRGRCGPCCLSVVGVAAFVTVLVAQMVVGGGYIFASHVCTDYGSVETVVSQYISVGSAANFSQYPSGNSYRDAIETAILLPSTLQTAYLEKEVYELGDNGEICPTGNSSLCAACKLYFDCETAKFASFEGVYVVITEGSSLRSDPGVTMQGCNDTAVAGCAEAQKVVAGYSFTADEQIPQVQRLTQPLSTGGPFDGLLASIERDVCEKKNSAQQRVSALNAALATSSLFLLGAIGMLSAVTVHLSR